MFDRGSNQMQMPITGQSAMQAMSGNLTNAAVPHPNAPEVTMIDVVRQHADQIAQLQASLEQAHKTIEFLRGRLGL